MKLSTNILQFVLLVSCLSNHSLASRQEREAQFGSKEQFDLKEIVDFVYRSDRWNGTWVSDSEYTYRNGQGDLALFSVVSGQSSSIVPASVLDEPRVFRFWLSPDQQFVLLAYRPQKLFRHSFIALYDVYNIRTGERIKLQPDQSALRGAGGGGGPPGSAGPSDGNRGGPNSFGAGRPGGEQPAPQLPLLFATWSPNGHSLAYVFSNNIYYRASPTSNDVQISTSGRSMV